jgi:hypothetical protein
MKIYVLTTNDCGDTKVVGVYSKYNKALSKKIKLEKDSQDFKLNYNKINSFHLDDMK